VRTTSITCDRCKAVISEGAAVLTVEAGNLRARLSNPLDLCSEC